MTYFHVKKARQNSVIYTVETNGFKSNEKKTMFLLREKHVYVLAGFAYKLHMKNSPTDSYGAILNFFLPIHQTIFVYIFFQRFNMYFMRVKFSMGYSSCNLFNFSTGVGK